MKKYLALAAVLLFLNVASAAPCLLSETGLYEKDGTAAKTLAAGNLEYEPRYPLWTDGARKRRWIYLPPDTRIDTDDIDAFKFPVGTKFWKEFAFKDADGVWQRVETRYMEKRANGSWDFATYVYRDEETEAKIWYWGGGRNHFPIPGTTLHHRVPKFNDCKLCHREGKDDRAVLGFGALQLSDDRDPEAVRGPKDDDAGFRPLTLRDLAARGLLTKPPTSSPRIPARDARERAALGYLFGNCAHCPQPSGQQSRGS